MFRSLSTRALHISASFDEQLDLARATGFIGLDFDAHELLGVAGASTAQNVVERFAAAGLRPGAWSLPLNFRGDEEAYNADLQALPRAAALAQTLGSSWCSTVVLPFSDERAFEENMGYHERRLRPAAQILADHGCRLGLEFIGPSTLRAGHPYTFISTIQGGLDLARRLGTGNVGLLLDAFHWYTSNGTAADIQALSANDIVYVHVNDAVAGRSVDEQMDLERDLPGATGVIDIATFMRAVKDTGFDGPVAVEPFNARVSALEPAEQVRLAAESLTRIWV
jgi:sugar phosphate isomerase/epimerase